MQSKIIADVLGYTSFWQWAHRFFIGSGWETTVLGWIIAFANAMHVGGHYDTWSIVATIGIAILGRLCPSTRQHRQEIARRTEQIRRIAEIIEASRQHKTAKESLQRG